MRLLASSSKPRNWSVEGGWFSGAITPHQYHYTLHDTSRDRKHTSQRRPPTQHTGKRRRVTPYALQPGVIVLAPLEPCNTLAVLGLHLREPRYGATAAFGSAPRRGGSAVVGGVGGCGCAVGGEGLALWVHSARGERTVGGSCGESSGCGEWPACLDFHCAFKDSAGSTASARNPCLPASSPHLTSTCSTLLCSLRSRQYHATYLPLLESRVVESS